MRLCYGWGKKELYLSQEKRYLPEQLYDRLKPFAQDKLQSVVIPALLEVPLWIHVDNQFVRIEGIQQLSLACKLICIYHNTDSRAPLSDSWEEETIDIEAKTSGWTMGNDDSDEDKKAGV